MAVQSVTLNYNGHYGYLDYNEETHEMTVFIPDGEAAAQKVRDFLNHPRKLEVPTDECTYHSGKSPWIPGKAGKTASRRLPGCG